MSKNINRAFTFSYTKSVNTGNKNEKGNPIMMTVQTGCHVTLYADNTKEAITRFREMNEGELPMFQMVDHLKEVKEVAA